MMLNIIVRKLLSPHGEFYVMSTNDSTVEILIFKVKTSLLRNNHIIVTSIPKKYSYPH